LQTIGVRSSDDRQELNSSDSETKLRNFFANSYSAPFDGRFANLDKDTLGSIINSSFGVQKGRFAEEYGGSLLVSIKPLPGLGIRTTLKIMKNDQYGKLSFLCELRAGTLRHFAIQPVFASYEDSYQLCILSAFAEGGDLEEGIKVDEGNWRDAKPLELCPKERFRILMQISLAIQYLHTEYSHKKAISHNDIKLANVVLDSNKNARLIDFGISRNNDDDVDVQSIGTPGYVPDTINEETIRKNMDFYSFGVLILAVLTGESPCESKVHTIKKCPQGLTQLVKDFLNATENCSCFADKCLSILGWDDDTFKVIKQIATNCLRSISNQDFSFRDEVCVKLDAYGRHRGFKNYRYVRKEEATRCEYCYINPVIDASFNHVHHESYCTLRLGLCQECVKSHYLNPIFCHSCGPCTPKVDGSSTALICLSGDYLLGNEIEKQIFQSDCKNVKDAIKKRLPGIKRKRVNTKGDFDKECKTVAQLKDRNTVFIFYSGHFGNSKFHLCEETTLTKSELESALLMFGEKQKVVLILDCCGAPDDLNYSQLKCDFIQINASRPGETVGIESPFSKLFVQALDSSNKRCKECHICEQFYSNEKDDRCTYLSIDSIAEFVQAHFNVKHSEHQVKRVCRVTVGAEKLVFNIRSNVTIDLKVLRPHSDDTDAIRVEYYSGFEQILRKSFSKYFHLNMLHLSSYKSQIKEVIQVQNMLTHEEIKCEKNLVAVWNSKQPIGVSLRPRSATPSVLLKSGFRHNSMSNCSIGIRKNVNRSCTNSSIGRRRSYSC